MKAVPIQKERIHLGDDRFVEVAIWSVPAPIPPTTHGYKYRLAFVVGGACVVRYDNERGKGDHKHIGVLETDYAFTTLDRLIEDFWADVERFGG
jgi:hypothetical protein